MNNKSWLNARYADLLPGEDDPALVELIRDLDTLYTTNPIPARLTYPQTVQPDVQAVEAFQPTLAPGVLALAPGSPRRWSRLSTLAAALVTLLLVGGLAGTFYVLRQATVAHQLAASPTSTLRVTATTSASPAATIPTQVIFGPQSCPSPVSSSAYWESVVAPYAYGGSYHVETVTCANLMNAPSLQALVTVRRNDGNDTLDAFVFNAITSQQPIKLFQLMGLVKGQAKISGYNTIMTAQADELSPGNQGKAVSSMSADLFREFKWSGNTGTFVQTLFPGIFPDLTRYQAEDDQAQVNQGQQAWKLSATQVAVALAVSLLDWSSTSLATLVSGGGTHDVNAVVQVRSAEKIGGSITVTLSRLEGNANGGIWEVIAVSSNGISLTAPAPQSEISSPVQVTGNGQAFEGVVGRLTILDHLYNPLGQATATGANGMGATMFSTSVTYQTTFPAGMQEGILLFAVVSSANGSLAEAIMEKVLIHA